MQDIQTITVIGLGLMGSSLAMALKASGAIENVVGYARSANTVKTALDLNLIDKGSCELKVAVKDADIVVLCTPPSTYSNIVKEITPVLKDNAILTDIGSVKHNPSWQILSILPEKKKPYFVPAHPIAGSERSGIEAKDPNLYQGKQVIITPGPITDKQAVATVEKMWEACGAITTEMDANKHDEIYASVSHAVQLLIYATITCIDHYGNEAMSQIAQNANQEFMKFTRIGGSNPLMWSGIFHANKSYLLQQVTTLNQTLSNLRDLLESKPVLVSERIRNAAQKRQSWKNEKAYQNKTLFSDEITDTMILLAPKIIATALVENTEYMDYAGSGFSDATAPLLCINGDLEPLLQSNKETLIDFLASLCMELEGLQHIIQFGEAEDIAQEFASAQEAHDCLIRIQKSFDVVND